MNTPTHFDDLPDILTVDEAAAFLRLGRSSVYDAIRTGEIKAVRIGRRILIPRSALKPFVDAQIHQ